jgi:hypothetical protein
MSGRIGVVVAGDVHANRSLVRPFLEDDGYRVDAEVFDAAELLPAVSGAMPDAVVVGPDLLAERPTALDDVRLVAPETKIVAIGAAPTGPKGIARADAYVEPGVGLAALSTVIGELVRNGQLVPAATSVARTHGGDAGLLRFVASVGLPILLVWTLIVAVTPRGIAPPATDTSDLAKTVILTPQGTDRLDEAYRSLDRLIQAIESDHPGVAAIWARTLMDARDGAIETGFITSALDDEITARLELVVGGLSDGPISGLQNILGALFPEIPDVQTPGGGFGVILEPLDPPVESGSGPGIVGSDDGGAGAGGGGDGNGGGGDGNDGGGGGDGNGGGHGEDPDDDGDPGDPGDPDDDGEGDDGDDDDGDDEDGDDDDGDDDDGDDDGDDDDGDDDDGDDDDGEDHGDNDDGDEKEKDKDKEKHKDEKEKAHKHDDGGDDDQGGGNDASNKGGNGKGKGQGGGR